MPSMSRITAPPLTNIPWQDAPDGCHDAVWRYSRNPIIPRDALPCSNSIFNSAAVPFGDAFAGVFRVDHRNRTMNLHAGFSTDGIHWEIAPKRIDWHVDGIEVPEYGYDPRVIPFEGKFLITFCAGYHGPCIGLGETTDFEEFRLLEYALMPFNRNGVLFPRRIQGKALMLSRPSDNGHTPFGEIFLSQSENLIHWGEHRWVARGEQPWESTKIGAGPVPIETSEGWLVFHHGVLTSCNGYVYHMGAIMLDLKRPWEVLARTEEWLLMPQVPYEQVGDVPNVTFPCAALVCGKTNRIALYYGGADTVTCLAFTTLDRVLQKLVPV